MIFSHTQTFGGYVLSRFQESPSPRVYTFGSFVLDVRSRELVKGAERRAIPEKLFRMLLLLVEANGRTVTRDEFLAKVWADGEATNGNLKQHAFLLRTLLGDNAHENYIVTVPRKGYRLAVPVERKIRTTLPDRSL